MDIVLLNSSVLFLQGSTTRNYCPMDLPIFCSSKEEGQRVGILVGQMTSILNFNCSSCKEEMTPPSVAEGFHYESVWHIEDACLAIIQSLSLFL
jgi:hypothetical protein